MGRWVLTYDCKEPLDHPANSLTPPLPSHRRHTSLSAPPSWPTPHWGTAGCFWEQRGVDCDDGWGRDLHILCPHLAEKASILLTNTTFWSGYHGHDSIQPSRSWMETDISRLGGWGLVKDEEKKSTVICINTCWPPFLSSRILIASLTGKECVCGCMCVW